ncbi:hypothetical protein [Acinetobacter sp. A47]|uniref:hypothetical protein n=1 Tax=Acinetobacter sp. A47 TaxID=1561217 RepID=UPI00056F590E|nr:hypothetical protein [Acinetobacter sp. A47]
MITTARPNHTSSFGGSSDERNPKEKFIDYCEYKYFLVDRKKWGAWGSREFTQAELVEKQRCEEAMHKKPFTTEYYFFICLFIIPLLFFSFCCMKGYLFIKKADREPGEKVDMNLEMSVICLFSFVLTALVWMVLYCMYFAYLYHKYQY